MNKRKVRITNTGYLPDSPDRHNPMNIIPSNQITMDKVPFPIMGIDNLGNQQMMMPGMDYTFPGQYVTEIPMGKYQKGGLTKYQKKGQVDPNTDPNQDLTYKDNPEWFDNRAVYSGNDKYDAQIRKLVYEGRASYNPATKVMTFLKPNQQTKVDQTTQTLSKDKRTWNEQDKKTVAKVKEDATKMTPEKARQYIVDNQKDFVQKSALAAGALAAPFAAPAVMGALEAPMVIAGSTVPQAAVTLNAGQAIGALGAGYGFTQLPNTWNTVNRAVDNPTTSNITDAATTLGVNALDFVGVGLGKAALSGTKNAGRFLTTQTPLKNAYKINPWAFKPNPNNIYRGIGKGGMEDAFRSGVIRNNPNKFSTEGIRAGVENGGFRSPYFVEGENFNIAEQYANGYIAETPLIRNAETGELAAYPAGNDWGWTGAEAEMPLKDFKILQKDWLRGYKPVEVPKVLPGSANAGSITNTAPVSWSMQEMPGLHLKSTMSGSTLEKQLSKTGEISRNNIIAHINKAETSAADKFTLQKVLDTKFPNQNKIDYNDFRKAVSDEAIELERKVLPDYQHNNWGVGRLGYPLAKRSSFDNAIKSGQENIQNLERRLSGTIESNPWETREDLEWQLSEAKNQLAKNLSEYEKLPLENVSITYENPTKFGSGSADHFDESTLGHARTLVSQEEPDIMHFLEQQSDYWQKLGKTKPVDLEKYEKQIARREAEYLEDLETLKKLKETKMDYTGNPKSDFEIAQFEDIVNKKGAELNLRKGNLFNPQQKEFLGKNYQERLLQENVKYAAEQGKSTVRVPTSETAAKIQGYDKKVDADRANLLANEISFLERPDVWKASEVNDYNSDIISRVTKELENAGGDVEKLIAKKLEEKKRAMTVDYLPMHQTILKKYSEQPKTIKKLFGAEPRVVTDGKGNTWYEFDIPESFKQGKAEIKAFRLGGFIREGSTTQQNKNNGLYLGHYEFKDGGLVQMPLGGANRYSGKMTADEFNQLTEKPLPLALQLPEKPATTIEEYMASKNPILKRDLEKAKVEAVEKKYSESPTYKGEANVYRSPEEHAAVYEKTADHKLRFKNEADYSEEDIKTIQKDFVDKGIFQSKQLDPKNYKTKEEVIALQTFLAENGLMDDLGKYGVNKDGIDGKLGAKTRAAIQKYNEHNKEYQEGVLDDATKKAIKDFKNAEDAKRALGLNVGSNLYGMVNEDGTANVGLSNQELSDFEKQLMKRGYFTGKDYNTDLISDDEVNPKVAFKFKLNPSSKTPFGMCAQYVNGTVCDEDAAGFEAREGLGLNGSAWHISDNIEKKGGKRIFAGLPERSQVGDLKNKDQITNYLKSTLSSQKDALKSIIGGGVTWDSKVRPGDVVNIFYEGSNYTEEAYQQTKSMNNRLFTTHVGVVKADDAGNLYVEHNVHGKVEKDKITDFLEGKVKGNGNNRVSMISGITRPNYYTGIFEDGSGIPSAGVDYYQTEYGQFNPKGVKARQDDNNAQSVAGKNTYKLLKTIEKNKDKVLKDIPITENEFDKLMRTTRAIPTLETYGGMNLGEPVNQTQKWLQDTFMSDREKSMGITKLKDESNLNPTLRKKLLKSDEELATPEKAALPTFYKVSKDYLYLKEVANKYGITNISTDQLAKLAGLAYNQSVGKIAKDLVEAGSYDNYISGRQQKAKAAGSDKFKYESLIDIYDQQTMKRGGNVNSQGLFLGKFEFKDGGLVKYQDKGEVNMYELERRAKAMGHNSIEDYRNANWGYGENHPKIVKLRQEYPYTWKLAKGLPSVERYKDVSPTQWFDMLDMIAQAESKNRNIRQGDDGPGRGYYQFEAPSTTTAKNRAIQIKKDLKSLGYDLQVPERFDTNFMNLSKDEQAFYALSNLIKGASAKREGNPNYKIDLTNPGKAWFDLHWAGAEKHPEDVNDRIAHWNESNPNYKIGFDQKKQIVPLKANGGLVKAQEGKEMPFDLPLKEQNIYLLPEYNQPINPFTGEILPDPQRPNLGMDTGATEYKYTYGSDKGDIDVPSIVAGQYIGDQALDRYMLTGERFKTMNDPGSYSKFYDQMGQLGLMQEKNGGSVRKVKIKRAPRKNQ